MIKWLKKKYTPKEVFVLAKHNESDEIYDLHTVSFVDLSTAELYLQSMKEEARKDAKIYRIKVEPWTV